MRRGAGAVPAEPGRADGGHAREGGGGAGGVLSAGVYVRAGGEGVAGGGAGRGGGGGGAGEGEGAGESEDEGGGCEDEGAGDGIVGINGGKEEGGRGEWGRCGHEWTGWRGEWIMGNGRRRWEGRGEIRNHQEEFERTTRFDRGVPWGALSM